MSCEKFHFLFFVSFVVTLPLRIESVVLHPFQGLAGLKNLNHEEHEGHKRCSCQAARAGNYRPIPGLATLSA